MSRYVRATHTYTAKSATQLSFARGAVLLVTHGARFASSPKNAAHPYLRFALFGCARLVVRVWAGHGGDFLVGHRGRHAHLVPWARSRRAKRLGRLSKEPHRGCAGNTCFAVLCLLFSLLPFVFFFKFVRFFIYCFFFFLLCVLSSMINFLFVDFW